MLAAYVAPMFCSIAILPVCPKTSIGLDVLVVVVVNDVTATINAIEISRTGTNKSIVKDLNILVSFEISPHYY